MIYQSRQPKAFLCCKYRLKIVFCIDDLEESERPSIVSVLRDAKLSFHQVLVIASSTFTSPES